jgi:hypothetical protein
MKFFKKKDTLDTKKLLNAKNPKKLQTESKARSRKRKYHHEKDLLGSNPEIKAFLLILMLILVLIGGFLLKFLFLSPTIEQNQNLIQKIPSLQNQISQFSQKKPQLQKQRIALINELEDEKNKSPIGAIVKLKLSQYIGILEGNNLDCDEFLLREPETTKAGSTMINGLLTIKVDFNCVGDYASYLKGFNELPILGDSVVIESQNIIRVKNSDDVTINGVFSFVKRK